MRVADEEVEAWRLGQLAEVQAEAARPGATVEHDQGTVGPAHFHARRVTAVTRRMPPGRGD